MADDGMGHGKVAGWIIDNSKPDWPNNSYRFIICEKCSDNCKRSYDDIIHCVSLLSELKKL